MVAIAILAIIVSAITFINNRSLTLNGKKFDVVVASTPKERERGLGGWEKLKNDQGMLFVYTDPGEYCMWMKDMKFSIDIVWFGNDKKVVSTEKNVNPNTYPQAFCPSADARYVLELPAGSVERYDINTGNQAKF